MKKIINYLWVKLMFGLGFLILGFQTKKTSNGVNLGRMCPWHPFSYIIIFLLVLARMLQAAWDQLKLEIGDNRNIFKWK